MNKVLVVGLMHAASLALLDSKNYANGTYGEGVEVMAADLTTQADLLNAEAEAPVVVMDNGTVGVYLADLDEGERANLLEPYLRGLEGQEDQRVIGDPVFYAIGSATFTQEADAVAYCKRAGIEYIPRKLGYLS